MSRLASKYASLIINNPLEELKNVGSVVRLKETSSSSY